MRIETNTNSSFPNQVVSDEVKALNEGDEIYYDRHAGHAIEFNEDQYTVIKIQDIVVVL